MTSFKIRTFAIILFGILVGISAYADTAELRLKVSTKSRGSVYYGVALNQDEQVVAVVCHWNALATVTAGFKNNYSADLVFPNDQGVLETTSYRSAEGRAVVMGGKSAYRPFSAEDANSICRSPYGEFVLSVEDDGVLLKGRRAILVQSFGVQRRPL